MNTEAASMSPRQEPELPQRWLTALEALLALRVRELSHEVTHYPSPIARCDEQLTKLIDQRTDALRRLRAVRAAVALQTDEQPVARRHAVEQLLDAYDTPEDGQEAALVAQLRAWRPAG